MYCFIYFLCILGLLHDLIWCVILPASNKARDDDDDEHFDNLYSPRTGRASKKELYYTLTKVNANLIQISMCILCSALLGSFQTNYTFTMPVILLSDKTNRASYIKKSCCCISAAEKKQFL